MKKPISIIVHGGAKEIPPEKQQAHREGVERAAEAGWGILSRGGSATDAVEAAIRVLEDDPTFNAGYGADLNADGEVQLDASIMEGKELQAGAVGFVQRVRHPISVARRMLGEKEILVVGDGGDRFAEELGAEMCANEDLITEERRQEWEKTRASGPASTANNTVGCAAMDAEGNLAAGASTGGTGQNRRGRVGDSPQIGAGVYADNECGASAWTGDGEEIARTGLAKMAVDLLGDLYFPDEVARKAIHRLERRVQGEGGCILIDRNGRIGWEHNSREMAVAYRSSELPATRAYVRKSEETRAYLR